MLLYSLFQNVHAQELNVNIEIGICSVTTDMVSMIGLYGAPLLFGIVSAIVLSGNWSKSLASRNLNTGPAVTAGWSAGFAIATIVFAAMLYVTSGSCFPEAWFLPSIVMVVIGCGLAGVSYSKV